MLMHGMDSARRLVINGLCYSDLIQLAVGIEMLESLLSNLGPKVSS